MFNIEITQAELSKIQYMDNAIKNMLSEKQEKAIEFKRINKILEARKRFLNTKNSKPFENKVYMNHLAGDFSSKWIKISDITNDMAEKELSLGFEYYKS